MRQRKVLVLLEKPDFDRLSEAARQNEREVYQEATYLLKGILRTASQSGSGSSMETNRCN